MPPSVHEDDIIVVKGEEDAHHWSQSHPSSPDSMSSHPDPAAVEARHHSSLQRLQSPGPLDEREDASQLSSVPNHYLAHTTESTPDVRPRPTHPNPNSNNKRPRPNAMTTEERLLAMPEKRPMPWRSGVDPGADVETGGESRRKQIRFGCLLATRGDVVPTPCVSCANGRGKFSVCVAVPSLFRGACAGCQLSGRPNRCSIKQGDDAAQSPGASTPGSGSRNVKKKLAKSHSPLMSKPDQRKSDDAPTWHTGSPQWPPELGASQARPQTTTTPTQLRWAAVNPPPLSQPQTQPQHQHQSQPQTQTLPQHQPQLHPQPHPQSQPQSQPQPTQPTPPITHRPNGNPVLSPSSVVSQGSMRWATVNQQRLQPVAHPSYSTDSNSSFPHRRMSRERREDTAEAESSTGAVIDTLPKNKQRQLYAVMSGLQGGIEHLQRELDSLKKALGVEDTD